MLRVKYDVVTHPRAAAIKPIEPRLMYTKCRMSRQPGIRSSREQEGVKGKESRRYSTIENRTTWEIMTSSTTLQPVIRFLSEHRGYALNCSDSVVGDIPQWGTSPLLRCCMYLPITAVFFATSKHLLGMQPSGIDFEI